MLFEIKLFELKLLKMHIEINFFMYILSKIKTKQDVSGSCSFIFGCASVSSKKLLLAQPCLEH